MFLFLFLTISFIPKLIQTFSHAPPEWLPGFDTYDPVRCGLSIPFKRNINRSKRKTILDSEFKVLGGESVKEGEYPWAVYIINPVLRCTGVLISKRHVLTTAHCFKKKGVNFACKTDGERIKCCNFLSKNSFSKSDAASKKTVLSTYFIQVGSICIGEQSTLKNCKLPEYAIKYTIKKAIYNQYYENNCIGRDYAIIELGHPIPFEQTFNSINNDNEKITIPPNIANHICLLHLDDKINKLDWSKLSSPVIFGWGQSVNFNGKMKSSSFLQKAKLISLMKQEDCKNYVRRYHEDILCVISKKNISTCAVKMAYQSEYQQNEYANEPGNNDDVIRLLTMLTMLFIIFCFCCVIYQVLNYQNEKAEFERIKRQRRIEFIQKRQLENLKRQQQSYSYVQPYIVYPYIPIPTTYPQCNQR
ncbi:hypothetical protein Mgra_00008706 [Meloidogyne graminicola]|uniref:Peptidase S1 domain-containing protein n=1 Tax=Meloidogyne graminicola TaxID=189291 RepID=A0A8S9ZF15_9BILA|nr:hypothetical protein Mgra_00008706 [Meloidogyne graminicola]